RRTPSSAFSSDTTSKRRLSVDSRLFYFPPAAAIPSAILLPASRRLRHPPVPRSRLQLVPVVVDDRQVCAVAAAQHDAVDPVAPPRGEAGRGADERPPQGGAHF